MTWTSNGINTLDVCQFDKRVFPMSKTKRQIVHTIILWCINAFRITDPLFGELIDHWCIPITKVNAAGPLDSFFFYELAVKKSRVAGDVVRYDALVISL